MSVQSLTDSIPAWLLNRQTSPSQTEIRDAAAAICDDPEPNALLSLGSLIDELSDAAAVLDAWHTFAERFALLAPSLKRYSEHSTTRLLGFSQTVNGALLQRLTECTQAHEESAAANLNAIMSHLATVQQVNNVANSALDEEQVLDSTVRAVTEVLKLDDCSIYLFDDEVNRLTLRASTGLNVLEVEREQFNLGEGIAGWAAQIGKPAASADALDDPRFAPFPEILEDPLRSIVSVPIILYTVNKLIGVLNLQTRSKTRKFSSEEIRFVETVCGQVAIAIDNARLNKQTDEKLREKVNQLTTLQRVWASIGSSLDLNQVLDMIARHAAEMSSADKAVIFKLDEVAQEFFVIAGHNLSEKYKRFRIGAHEGALGRSLADRAVHVGDAQNSPDLAQFRPQLQDEGIRSLLWVPLIARGRPLGGIAVLSLQRREFSEEQIQLASMFAYDAALAIENARLYQEAQRALESQAVLMREMQHRVKNNLQTVASLLSLQMRRAESTEAAALLGLSAARVESIAAVHELFSEEDIGLATVGEIANRIMDIVLKDLAPPSQEIEFAIEPAPIELGSKQATLFALVLNELVSNAIMHGLAGRAAGSIRVTASHDDGTIAVDVWNSGRSMPEDFSMQTHAGLGLSIVEQLVTNELSGTFQIENGTQGGATARITFPAKRDDLWTVWWKD